MKGRVNATQRIQEYLGWLAWHTAVLGRVDKVPALEQVTGRRREVKKMTPAEVKGAFASMREIAQVTAG